MVFDWVRESPFSYLNLGWKKWKSGKVTWFSWQPPVPQHWWVKAWGNGLLSDVPAGRPCGTGLLLAHTGRTSVLQFWLVKDVFSPLLFFLFWTRRHLTVDHRQGRSGQPAVSVTNCHQHCLSSCTGWTDDGHLNGRHHSASPPPLIHRDHRYSSPRPPPASLSVFWVIHM